MENIRIITEPIPLAEIKRIAGERFGDMVKGVVDVERGIMAIGGEMHADEEAILLEDGSEQMNLWGINIYPDMSRPEMIEFDSMINIRPNQGNRSRSVEDSAVQRKILEIVNGKIV